jgi:hypothetical protein
MHERRNLGLVLLLAAALVWATVAWFFLDQRMPLVWAQRSGALALGLATGAWLAYAMWFEDRVTNHLKAFVGPVHYDVDGLSFMPMVRVRGGCAELCVYYQNRYENPVEAVVHLRPVDPELQVRPGWRDLHFAFKADGGDFGVIQQPIAVAARWRGEVMEFLLAAASYYPRGHGSRLCRGTGMECGTLLVDWTGAAFRTGVHEVSGEIDLYHPARVHLSLPNVAAPAAPAAETWYQERLHAVAT